MELAQQLTKQAKRPRRPNGKVPVPLAQASKKAVQDKRIIADISYIAGKTYTPGKLSNWCRFLEIEIRCWTGKAIWREGAFCRVGVYPGSARHQISTCGSVSDPWTDATVVPLHLVQDQGGVLEKYRVAVVTGKGGLWTILNFYKSK